MADINFSNINDNGEFSIGVDNGSKAVTGNRYLANRFQITFLTKSKLYIYGDGNKESDGYGGGVQAYAGTERALDNPESVMASMSIAVDKAVDDIKSDQKSSDPTERIESASVLSVDIAGTTVYSTIKIVPEKMQTINDLLYIVALKGI